MELDEIMTVDTAVDTEVAKDTATETQVESKTFTCNADNHEGDRQVKLGFNFRELRSKKEGDSYKNYEFWYRNICKPCGQNLLLEAQKA
jgi:hypothetical protein